MARYRPFVVVVAAVAVVVTLPDADEGAPAAPLSSVDAGVPPGFPSPNPAQGGSVTEGRQVDATGQPARTGAAAPRGGDGAAAASTRAKYPGVGTPEALGNPECDPATGRIRFPSVFAPMCVAPWPQEADNGGATAQGVTADKIKVLVLCPTTTTSTGCDADTQAQWRRTFASFDQHYELWGRHVELVFRNGAGEDEVAQRSDAIAVAAEVKPFVSTTASAILPLYSREVAARGVVTFDFNVPWKETQSQAPYRWASQVDERTQILQVTEYVGKRLVGRPARWAGDATMQARPRQFGLVYPETWDKPFFDQQAARYGVQMADALTYREGDTAGNQERARTIATRMRDRGVTSVIAATDYIMTVLLTQAATTAGFLPEWVITGYNLQDVVLFARLYDQQQWSHAFGIGPVQALVPPPEYETISVYTWHHGAPPGASETGDNGNAWVVAYQLFIGLHLAGPDLNAETLRNGFFSFKPAGGVYCGCVNHIGVSYGRGREGVPWDDYTGWDDFTELWWDPQANGPDEAGITQTGGMYRRVDGGKRYVPGQWPTTEPKAFVTAGSVTLYDDYAPGNAPPRYEHKPH